MLQSPILHLLQRSVKCLWWFGKHCLNSECTCAHLSAHGCNGHKMRCGQKHCWRRGLRLLINKNLVWRQCYHISVILREHYQDSDMHTDLFPLPRSVLSYFLANPPLNHQFAIVQTHLAFKGNVRWLSNWFITSWPKLIHESRNLCLSVCALVFSMTPRIDVKPSRCDTGDPMKCSLDRAVFCTIQMPHTDGQILSWQKHI